MSKEFKQLEENPLYEINEEGKVRKIDTRKYKSLVSDIKGRAIVTLTDTKSGSTICYYIAELLEKYFDIKCEETFQTGVYEKYKQMAEDAEKAAADHLREIESLKSELSNKSSTIEDYKKELDAAKAAGYSRKPKTFVKCEETGQEFKGVAACAKAFGFNYDKFYNAFYLAKSDEIEFDNKHFAKYKVGA